MRDKRIMVTWEQKSMKQGDVKNWSTWKPNTELGYS